MIRSRIAPTPSGYLHTGNALNFIMAWLHTRRAAGTLRLRIDDSDTARTKPEYLDDIFRSLEWMGLDWDEGPQTPDEETHLYAQALRQAQYDALLQKLIDTGLVYACHCSRRDMQAQDCHCREKNLPLNMPGAALRLVTAAAPIRVQDAKAGVLQISLDAEMRDFIIRRRDGVAAYQLTSLADDINYGINLIIRGSDLLASTAAQLYMAGLIHAESFMQTTFYHHPLLHDAQGQKLSKSAGSLSLKAMREGGVTREAFYIRMSGLINAPVVCTSLHELLESGVELL